MPQNDDTWLSQAVAFSLFAAGLPGATLRHAEFAELRATLDRLAADRPKEAREIQALTDTLKPTPDTLKALDDLLARLRAGADSDFADRARRLLDGTAPAAAGAASIEVRNTADTVHSEVNSFTGCTVDGRKSYVGAQFDTKIEAEKVNLSQAKKIVNNFTF